MNTAAPTLDSWTTLFLLAAGQGVFLAVLLFLRSRSNHREGFWLSALMLTFSCLLVFNVSFWTRYNWYFPPLNLIYPAFSFLTGPLLLFYLDDRSAQAHFRHFRMLHFLPAMLVFFLALPGYLKPVSDLQEQITQTQMIRTPLQSLGLDWLGGSSFVVLHLLVYGLWIGYYGYRLYSRPGKAEARSPDEQVFRQRTGVLTGLYLLYTLAFLLYFVLVKTSFFQVEHNYLISWVMALAIYAIGYLEYRPAERLEALPKYSASSLTAAAVASIAGKLERCMQERCPYRNNELRLNDLAEELGVSPHHLSQVINEHYGKSFNQFINEHRIREAMQLLAAEAHRQSHIIEIAYQVGFNNKTTFNQVFKSSAGMSPTEWRNLHIVGPDGAG